MSVVSVCGVGVISLLVIVSDGMLVLVKFGLGVTEGRAVCFRSDISVGVMVGVSVLVGVGVGVWEGVMVGVGEVVSSAAKVWATSL